MTIVELEQPTEASRAKRLKAATNAAHEALDQRIMRSNPFASRERYALFLAVQYQFHREIDALFADPIFDGLLPDLAGRRRLDLIALDLADLGVAVPSSDAGPVFPVGAKADVPTALGWMYVAEGSNLGAAFLLKEAAKLGLSETFGARHLAAAPEGRGLHWRTYVAALDAIALADDEEQRVIAGGNAAFARVRALVESEMPAAAAV